MVRCIGEDTPITTGITGQESGIRNPGMIGRDVLGRSILTAAKNGCVECEVLEDRGSTARKPMGLKKAEANTKNPAYVRRVEGQA